MEKYEDRRDCADVSDRHLSGERIRPFRHDRQRLGVDMRLVRFEAPGSEAIVLHADESPRSHTVREHRSSVGRTSTQNAQRRILLVRTELLHSISSRRTHPRADRHDDVPCRISMRVAGEQDARLRVSRRAERVRRGMARNSLDRLLLHAVDYSGALDANRREDRGRDINRVVELGPDLALGPNAFRPMHDEWISRSPEVRILLAKLERRVSGQRPADRVVVVRSVARRADRSV
jgi:hypothetical protein